MALTAEVIGITDEYTLFDCFTIDRKSETSAIHDVMTAGNGPYTLFGASGIKLGMFDTEPSFGDLPARVYIIVDPNSKTTKRIVR